MSRRKEYALYLESDEWRTLRKAVFRRDGYRCQKCPCRFQLRAHHVFYRARFEDTQLADLITLCDHCHAVVHGKEKPVMYGERRRLARAKFNLKKSAKRRKSDEDKFLNKSRNWKLSN